MGDRAYDSDPLDQTLAAQGIELSAPHRCNRKRAPTQDGRPLRRYRRRGKIERLFAWLNKYRRVMTRWDRCSERFTAFVHLALAVIVLRRLQRYL
jgi:transposase